MGYEGSRFDYDERKKELRASKIWTIKGEKEIKETLAQLGKQKKGYEDALKKNKEILESPEMSPELKKLSEQLGMISRIKTKQEKKEQLEQAVKQNEEDLKEVKKDINKIKQAIGSRLKL